MAKLATLHKMPDYHVIQVNRAKGRVAHWHTIPGLIYRSKALAQDGLHRLLSHGPQYRLRVRRWNGETVSTITKLAKAA